MRGRLKWRTTMPHCRSASADFSASCCGWRGEDEVGAGIGIRWAVIYYVSVANKRIVNHMFRNLFALFAGVILLVLGFMFSVVILAVIALLGLCALGYVWWKTRKLRQAIRAQDAGSQIINGEAVVIEEYHRTEKVLPDDPSSQ